MTILFVGGGTLGPVTPLLAVARRMKQMRPGISFAWAGTLEGPERDLIAREHIPFFAVPSAKLPRYPTFAWLTWPRDYLRAKRAARGVLHETNPSLVVGMGGYTQVPVMRAAKKQGIPCAIHQLDDEPGLSNKLVASFCVSVSSSFAYIGTLFGKKTRRIATPTRFSGVTIPDAEAAASRFFLEPEKPIIFVLGGGTGAQAINEAIGRVRSRLSQDVQMIHATGKGKLGSIAQDRRNVIREFFDEQDMLYAYAAADLIICRAGMGTLTDLAALQKAAIVVPIPNSHQEANARALGDSIIFVRQDERLDERLGQVVTKLIADRERLRHMGEKLHQLLPTDDGTMLAMTWIGFAKEKPRNAGGRFGAGRD